MIAAVGASRSAGSTGSGRREGPPVALLAQLERCSQQLADAQSCPTANTPQGRKLTAALVHKLQEIKLRIERSDQSGSNPDRALPPTASASAANTGFASTSEADRLGSRLNVYA